MSDLSRASAVDDSRADAGALSGPTLAPVLVIAGVVVIVLISLAHGYGYHRDELYFLAAGDHLAWSYPDQGPLTPLLAHLMSLIAPDSLTLLRTPSALMAGGCVLFSALIAREFGGSGRAQLISAACTAAAPVVLSIGHLLSTSTYDLLAWTVVSWLICRAIRTAEASAWLGAGLITGTALLNKPLIALLVVSIGAGVLAVGPRQTLRTRWVWTAFVLAVAMWSPWLVWQARHGWPQLHISTSIAHGGSSTSQPRWALIPFQFLLAGPPLAPVWLVGLAALSRSRDLRPYRCFAVAWLFLVVVFEVAGGKPYYLTGLLPVLFSAGAIEVDTWISRGAGAARGRLLAGAVLASAAASALIALPILPAKDAGPVVAMNSDIGETIGWPEFTRQVAAVERRAPQPAVVLTENYGEAGAVDHFGHALDLPPAYSGHNGFGYWGPPSGGYASVVTIGIRPSILQADFRGCRAAAQVSNRAGIDNEEHGALIAVCDRPRESWRALWPHLTHLS
jgi:4-amino-4-deoxy-L-arabinose transferase-like glycosyltransferase